MLAQTLGICLFRKQQLHLEARLPFRPSSRRRYVVEDLNLRVDRLLAELEQAPEPAADGHGPFSAVREPIRGDDGARGEVPAIGEIVVHERLDQHLIDVRTLASARKRPDIVGERAEQPMPLYREDDDRRSCTPAMVAEILIGRGRQQECRPDAPDDFARLCRREEERGIEISDPELLMARGRQLGLGDHRRDPAGDQVPIRIDRDWNDGLDVEDLLRRMKRPDTEIRIRLKWEADEVGDRVLRFFRELFG